MAPTFQLNRGQDGQRQVLVRARGIEVHTNPLLNKGTAFPLEERQALGLTGFLPPRVTSIEEQTDRVLENHRNIKSDLGRYMDLMALMDRNETLFYRLLAQNIEEMMPVIYTPTVGEACQRFGHIFHRGRGLYITQRDRGSIAQLLQAWPLDDIQVIVVTDGSRILGLGDLGSGGMGIGIGKLSLYVAGGGVHPARVLPICLDVGTDNEELLADPKYLGVRERRLRGDAYVDLIDEFMSAVAGRFPATVVQFEDFATPQAIALLARYRDRYRCFNDDIQGTAAVVAAGVLAAEHRAGRADGDLKIVMAGAGSAAVGIADLIVSARVAGGEAEESARQRLWFVDRGGLIHDGRQGLSDHKARFARPASQAAAMLKSEGATDLLSVVRYVAPTALLGASGSPGLFDRDVVSALAGKVAAPTLFMLSNPTTKAECTPEQALAWSQGRAVVATGSPFSPVSVDGRPVRIGQANNVFIFPGLGLGVLAAKARIIPDSLFLAAMRALGEAAPDDALYPAIRDLRAVSMGVAHAVAIAACEAGVAEVDRAEVEARLEELVWEPEYAPYIAV